MGHSTTNRNLQLIVIFVCLHCCYENVTAHVSLYLLQFWSMIDAIPPTLIGRRSPHDTKANQSCNDDMVMSPRANDSLTFTAMMSSEPADHHHATTMGYYTGKHNATLPSISSDYVSYCMSVPGWGQTMWRYSCLGGPPPEWSGSSISSAILTIYCMSMLTASAAHIYNHIRVWLCAITCSYVRERYCECMGKIMLCCWLSSSHLISHILVMSQYHTRVYDSMEWSKRICIIINYQSLMIFLCIYIVLFLQIYGYPHIPPVYFDEWGICIICNGIVPNANLPITALLYPASVYCSLTHGRSICDCEYPSLLVLMDSMCRPEYNIKLYLKHMYRYKVKHRHRYMVQHNIIYNENVDVNFWMLCYVHTLFLSFIRTSEHNKRP